MHTKQELIEELNLIRGVVATEEKIHLRLLDNVIKFSRVKDWTTDKEKIIILGDTFKATIHKTGRYTIERNVR